MKDGVCLDRPMGFLLEAFPGLFEVVFIDFVTDAAAPAARRGNVCCSGAHEWIKHNISNETELRNKPFCQLQGERCGVFFSPSRMPASEFYKML